MDYVPNGPDTVIADYYSEEYLDIKWFDYSFTQEKYLLERKLNDGNFEIIKEFLVGERNDTTSYRDTATLNGNYTYRVKAIYPTKEITTPPTKTITARNWLPLAEKNFRYGELVTIDHSRVLSYQDSKAGIYSHDDLSWEKINVTFCENKLSEVTKLKNGNVAVLCTSSDLESGDIGIFVLNNETLQWSLTGTLIRQFQDFDTDRDKPSIISLSNGNLLVVGFSESNTSAQYTIAELFNPQLEESELVDPNNHRAYIHDSTPNPTGIEINENNVFINSGSGENSCLVFDSVSKTWNILGNSSLEISDLELLKDGRILAVDGTSSGFNYAIFNFETGSWTQKSQQTYSGFVREILKLPNENIFSIDAGGIVYLYESETSSWKKLQSLSAPAFNFQYTSATVYRENKILVNSSRNTNYIYRPSPDEEVYFN